jgi:hypothetical protein
MAGNTSVGFLGDQDLVYGFDMKNVSACLTARNWRRKAIIRQYRYGLLYVWVWERNCRKDGKEWVDYAVKVKRLEGEGGRHFERTFDNVEDALRYANGEDGSAFSRHTHAVGRVILAEEGEQLPGGKPAPTIFSVMGMGHKVEIPGPKVPEKKHRKEEKITLEPETYSGFLTKVLRSVLKIAPDMSKHVYTYGLTLHPDVKTRVRLGQNLPDRTTVRIYKGWDKLAARFHVFPNEPRARGLIRAVRIDDSGGNPGGKARPAVRKASRKSVIKT